MQARDEESRVCALYVRFKRQVMRAPLRCGGLGASSRHNGPGRKRTALERPVRWFVKAAYCQQGIRRARLYRSLRRQASGLSAFERFILEKGLSSSQNSSRRHCQKQFQSSSALPSPQFQCSALHLAVCPTMVKLRPPVLHQRAN